MCEPRYYRIGASDPKLNPYMNPAVQPDPQLVYRQFYNLVDVYRLLGIEIYFLEPREALFDQVFTANVAWGIRWSAKTTVFVMANLRPEWRHEEVPIAAQWLTARGFDVVNLPENFFFEGQGDMVTIRNDYFYCHGIRNSAEALEAIAEHCPPEKLVIPLRLVSPEFYHGDVCFHYLGPGSDKVIWYPAAFDEQSRNDIEFLFGKRALAIEKNFAVQKLPNGRFNFPLNGIYHNGVITFPWNSNFGGFPQKVRRFVEEDGLRVVLLDFSEFGLSGAGHRCCTLFLD